MPREIFENWACVVFHMTDLPYGRGGSPLQNLIVRVSGDDDFSDSDDSAGGRRSGLYEACVIFGGDSAGNPDARFGYYFSGNDTLVFGGGQKLIPVPQEGEPVLFRRRKPEEGK